MITKYLHLTDSYGALIFPGLMTPFLIILMKNFIRSAVPEELFESAKIDGAGISKYTGALYCSSRCPGLLR